MIKKISYKTAVEEITDLISDCDADTLSAIYLSCFASVISCYDSPDEDCLVVNYNEDLI